MSDINQCNFVGRLGRDPETRFMADGKAVTNFSIAVGWKGKDSEGTEWVRISSFGKLAEICGEYLKKGSQVFISGAMKTRKWTDKDGAEKYTTEITANQMQMLGGKPDGAKGEGAKPAAKPSKGTPGPFDDMNDDIPF